MFIHSYNTLLFLVMFSNNITCDTKFNSSGIKTTPALTQWWTQSRLQPRDSQANTQTDKMCICLRSLQSMLTFPLQKSGQIRTSKNLTPEAISRPWATEILILKLHWNQDSTSTRRDTTLLTRQLMTPILRSWRPDTALLHKYYGLQLIAWLGQVQL